MGWRELLEILSSACQRLKTTAAEGVQDLAHGTVEQKVEKGRQPFLEVGEEPWETQFRLSVDVVRGATSYLFEVRCSFFSAVGGRSL